MKRLVQIRTIATSLIFAATLSLGGCLDNLNLRQVGVRLGNDDARLVVAFSDDDRLIINRYYANNRGHTGKPGKGWKKRKKGMPPGLAKKNRLPPGLAKKRRLPSGLDRTPLPAELERRLGPVPSGYLRAWVGGSIVLMNQDTEVVLDLVYDLGNL